MTDTVVCEVVVARRPNTPAELEAAVHGFARAEKSAATRRAYRSDFGTLTAWCEGLGFLPLPAAPEGVAAFLADQAEAGVRPSTLSRRVAAIAYAHDLAGLPSPARAKAVRVVLGGIRRTKGAKPAQKAPATAERIAAMLEAIPDTLRGTRDRALLTLGFAGAFRRSELVALDSPTWRSSRTGCACRSGTPRPTRKGRARDRRSPRHEAASGPGGAGVDRAAKIKDGPVFRSIDRHGHVSGALTPQSVALIVKRYADAAGLDPRVPAIAAGGVPDVGAEAGADVLRMMQVSPAQAVETVQGYVRRANLFMGHAGTGFL